MLSLVANWSLHIILMCCTVVFRIGRLTSQPVDRYCFSPPGLVDSRGVHPKKEKLALYLVT